MSSIKIDDIINFAKANNQTHVCLTDTNLYGAIEFYNKAKANNLKPIIGLNIKYNNQDVYLIAKNNNGYKNLIKISSHSLSNEQFDLNVYSSDLFIFSENIDALNLNKTSDLVSFSTVAVNPVFFEKKEDVIYFKSLLAIANSKQLSEYANDHSYDEYYMLTPSQAQNKYSDSLLNKLDEIINQCEWSIEFNTQRHMIKFPTKQNTKVLLQTLCVDGLNSKLKNRKIDVNKYIERLKYELNVVDQMGFNDYFLVVQDYVSEAKNRGILVGPGRGSAAGSLIAYSLGITEIDPIEHDLIFERFLNPERSTMPDIDVDFMDDRRNEVIEYLFQKYGKEHVAHIVIFQRIKAKMAIRDVGRILGMEKSVLDNISKLLLDEPLVEQITNKKISEYVNLYKELFDIAQKIDTFPRQVGIHAAGVVLSDDILSNIIPVQLGPNGCYLTQYSMEYLEPLGLIKMDILGLVNLSTINKALKLIKTTKNIDLNLRKIPMDDSKVFNYIAMGNTAGIFQLESSGMTQLVKKIKPTNIEDISICSALYRPGPQKNIPTYLHNKSQPDEIKYLNDKIKNILSSTYNIIIYQEQVIQMVQQVANFSLAEADLFRRAISKKKIDSLSKLEKKFIEGGIKNGYDYKEVKQIFDYIFEFANYGFNHSHSLAYSYISYWLAYIAYYYPLEFFTTLLISNDGSSEKTAEYVAIARQNGISISPIDINQSVETYSINDGSIILGFNCIKGIGVSISDKIISLRNSLPNKKFDGLVPTILLFKTNGIGLKTILLLITSGAFDNFDNENNLDNLSNRWWLLKHIEKTFNICDEFSIEETKQEISWSIEDKPTNDDIKLMLKNEFALTNILFVDDPILKIKKNLNYTEHKLYCLNEINSLESNFYHVLVQLTDVRCIVDRNKKQMAFITFNDETKTCKAVVFAGVYEKISDILEKNKYLILTLRTDIKKPGNFIVANAHKIDY